MHEPLTTQQAPSAAFVVDVGNDILYSRILEP